nr:MAG TPA: tail protein [Caudoviricetes sp.]
MGGLVTVYAQHISYDLSGVAMPPFTAQGITGAFAAINASALPSDSGFAYWTDKTGTQGISSTLPLSVRSLLGGVRGSILDVYGGEYEFDRFTVRLWAKRGEDRGVTIRYGKDLTSLEQEASCAAVYTAVYPYWTSGEATVELPEKTVSVPGTFDFTRILPLDLSSSFDDAPSVDRLRTAAQYYITDNKLGVPRVSLNLSFTQLDGERVDLCDTVSVVFPAMGVTARAKVIRTTFDVLRDRYKGVDVGDIRANVADTIAAQAQDLDAMPTTQAMQKAILNATGWITGTGGGYVVFKRNDSGQATELLIMDSPEMSTAKNVWRWNLGGLGFSRNGVSGPYETAITQDGSIVGKFVTADGLHVYAANVDGVLQANQINAASLHVNAANVDGTFSADKIVGGTIDADQINVTNLNADNINSGSLKGAYLADAAVTVDKIGSGAVTNPKIQYGAVGKAECTTSLQNLIAEGITANSILAGTGFATDLTADVFRVRTQFRFQNFSSPLTLHNKSSLPTYVLGAN